MDLYLDNQKRKVHLNGQLYIINIPSSQNRPINVLISSDGYLLKDSNGLFLTVKVGE